MCAAVVGGLLACSATGCSARIEGRATPADHDGPRPVPAAALHGALLDTRTINDIMGASGMAVRDAGTRLFSGVTQFTDPACMPAWTPAEETAYAGTDWTSAFTQSLLETPVNPDHFVIQAVVRFPSRESASGFFDRSAEQWPKCAERTFDTRADDGQPGASWQFDVVRNADSTLWMTQTQNDSPGWGCQRALRVSRNVAIDVLACKFYATDEAVTIAHGIDARLPSV